MEQWLVLSNVNYIQYNRNPIDCNKLDTRALEPKNHKRTYGILEEDYRQIIDLVTTIKVGKNIHMCIKEFKSEILYTT